MSYTKEELFKMFQDQGIPFTPVYDTKEVVDHPHFRETGFFNEIESSFGKVKIPGAPYRFSETPWSVDQPAPRLGEHNQEIYSKYLGYSKITIARLHQIGVI